MSSYRNTQRIRGRMRLTEEDAFVRSKRKFNEALRKRGEWGKGSKTMNMASFSRYQSYPRTKKTHLMY